MNDEGQTCTQTDRSRRTAKLLVLIVALLAGAHALSFLGAGPDDDDFIVYRYARNWIEGHGLVFNTGERFEGFTVPLWLMLIAGGLRLGLDPVRVSLTLSILASVGAAWAIGEAWRRRFPESRLPVPALLLAAIPGFAWHSVVGLGTSLLAALLAFALLTYESASRRDRPPWACALFLALACLLRQECALFVLPFLWIERRGRGRVVALLPLLALAGWTLFRLWYYGRLVPLSYTSKKLPVLADLAYGLSYFGRATLECGIGLLAIAALLVAWRERGKLRNATLVFASGLVLHTFYVVWVGGDYMPLGRFFMPALPLGIYFGCIAVRGPIGGKPLAAAIALVLALLLPQWRQELRPQLYGEQRFFEERWEELGRHLAAVLAPETSVALAPIGAFGWYSGLPIVDILGLTNESVVGVPPALDTVREKGHHRFNADWVLEQRPDYVILASGVVQPDGMVVINPWEHTIFLHPRFREAYVPLRMWIPGGEDLMIHMRGELEPPRGCERVPW